MTTEQASVPLPLPPIRPATLDDVPEIRSILAEHGNDGPHPAVDIVGPYLRHLIGAGHALVADEGHRLAAYGSTVGTGRGGRHLTDLFVRRDRLGGGIGRQLLDGIFADAWPRTTFASDDPRAMPLYIRAGMAPLWTCVYLLGPVSGLPAGDADVRVESAEPGRLAELELRWTGADRAVDHAFWATQADADPFVVIDGDDVVAGGYGRARQKGPDRALDRLVIRPDCEPLGPIYAALRRAAAGGLVQACLPGPNPALRPLLAAGFRIVDRDTFMASEPDLIDPARLLPNPGML
jgi:GNAT superfamily N-acetyltransferase